MNFKKLTNRTVLITGASSGIGQALARELARRGANLVLAARRGNRLIHLKKTIGTVSEKVAITICDVTKKEDLESAIALAHQNFGPVEIVIANAAIPMVGTFNFLTMENYRTVFETNVFSMLQTCYTALEDLKQTKGTLVLIGSISAYMASPGASAYAMSKYAVRAFAEAIRSELAVFGIKVVLISPGFVESELRMIDNYGTYHPESKDWVPSFLVMRADKAARQIVSAIVKGKREKFITWHGYGAYWVRQYWPWLYFLLADRLNQKFRRRPK